MSRAAGGAPHEPEVAGGDPDRPDSATVLDAASLFRGRREILIAHAGQRYRLRITQNGKLILTK